MGNLSDEILLDLKGKKGGAPMGASKPKVEVAVGKDDAPDASAGDSYAGDEDSIAADLKQALDEGDTGGIKEALKSFIEACYPQLADSNGE